MLSDKEYASIWQPDIFYMNKEPDELIRETIISPGKQLACLQVFWKDAESQTRKSTEDALMLILPRNLA